MKKEVKKEVKKETPKKMLLLKKSREKSNNAIGLYIHIPFCKYICKYCDFCKKYIKKYDTSSYIDKLILNLKMYEDYFSNIDTIYIGGGTPSALPLEDLKKLLLFLKDNIKIENIMEFTLEANPDDVNDLLIETVSKLGVNRISLGVQTLDNNILKEIGRDHTKEDVENAINIIPKYIENINIDLMFNLPYQNKESLQKDLEFVKSNKDKIRHISYYSLILEENTILYNQDFSNFSEDEEDEIYKCIQSDLESLGYNQYEISNYSNYGYESKHNFKYWLRKEYIGVGLGASSFINNKRYTITKSYNDYINGIQNNELKLYEEEIISDKEAIEEAIMLGLRTNKGIDKEIFVRNQLSINSKYLKENGGRISIRKEYYFLSNEIIIDILNELDEKQF